MLRLRCRWPQWGRGDGVGGRGSEAGVWNELGGEGDGKGVCGVWEVGYGGWGWKGEGERGRVSMGE